MSVWVCGGGGVPHPPALRAAAVFPSNLPGKSHLFCFSYGIVDFSAGEIVLFSYIWGMNKGFAVEYCLKPQDMGAMLLSVRRCVG